jgi:putative heme iron utilization protein
MSQHATSGPPPSDAPELPFAEQARTLVHRSRTGTLSTLSQRQPGFPFGSVSLFGLDATGRPTFLISTMAMHTQNLAANPNASLLVAQATAGDALAAARVTLLGPVSPVPATERDAVRADYLKRHPGARDWVDFDDFAFHRMDVVDCYYVAGFGAMGWVAAGEYLAAAADPLADASDGILEHMNADHADALKLYCEVFAKQPAESATMTAVDRLGFRVRARTADGLRGLRIAFPREVRTTQDARVVLVEMVREARARSGTPEPAHGH